MYILLSADRRYELHDINFLMEHGTYEIIKYTLDKHPLLYNDDTFIIAAIYGRCDIIVNMLSIKKFSQKLLNEAILKGARYENLEVVLTLLEEDVDTYCNNYKLIKLCIKNDYDDIFLNLFKTGKIDPMINNGELFILAAKNGNEIIIDIILDDKRFNIKERAIIESISNSYYELSYRLEKL